MPEKAKKPVMDVEKPGATPASATSRPLITSKGPAIKDPMVNDDETQPSEELQLVPSKKKTIQPLSEQAAKAPEQPAPVAETSTEDPENEQPLPEDAPLEETAEAKANTAALEVSEEDRKRQELVDKLVVEKKYFVPIGAVQKKRTAQTAVVVLISLILIAVGVVLVIDAELVSVGVNLPFDLIK